MLDSTFSDDDCLGVDPDKMEEVVDPDITIVSGLLAIVVDDSF